MEEEIKRSIKEKLEELLELPSFFFEESLNVYEKDSLVEVVYNAKSGYYKEQKDDKENDRDYYRNLSNSKDERNKKIVKLLSRLLKEFGVYS